LASSYKAKHRQEADRFLGCVYYLVGLPDINGPILEQVVLISFRLSEVE